MSNAMSRKANIHNTCLRDFYNIYILTTTQKFDKTMFADALKATAAYHGTTGQMYITAPKPEKKKI